MREAIKQSRCQSFIPKHLGPIRKAQIGISYLEYEPVSVYESVIECSQDPGPTVRLGQAVNKERGSNAQDDGSRGYPLGPLSGRR
jgi:hypothetical protein